MGPQRGVAMGSGINQFQLPHCPGLGFASFPIPMAANWRSVRCWQSFMPEQIEGMQPFENARPIVTQCSLEFDIADVRTTNFSLQAHPFQLLVCLATPVPTCGFHWVQGLITKAPADSKCSVFLVITRSP